MEVVQRTHTVEIFTAEYTVSGEFQPLGNPAVYLNDPAVSSLRVLDATLTPLMSGARLGEMTVPEVFVPREKAHVILIGSYRPEQANLLPQRLPMVAFTDSYAVRGTFYGGTETRASDLFAPHGPFFPVTGFEIFTLRPLMVNVAGALDLAFINKHAVIAYHPAQ
jgi:hypothetical protein